MGVRLALADEEDAAPWTAAALAPPEGTADRRAVAREPGTDSRRPDLRRQGSIAAGLRNRLLRLAAFQNPEFYKAQAMRLPTYDKPRIIGCAEDHPHHIGLPRGCLEDVRKLLSDLGSAPCSR